MNEEIPYFPYSSIPMDTDPDDSWARCGTCNRLFPDIYPSGRCPFEYDHPARLTY